MHACSAITFNHESERRPLQFVTRKITDAAAAISLGLRDGVTLGDMGAERDWSFAGDFMEAAWLMLQHDQPDDYVLASGTGHTVLQFAQAAFGHVGLEAERHITVDESLVRAPERTPSVGDPSRALERLGWRPRVAFGELVARMVDADLQRLRLQPED
jgi:GDPmannose 4,6-dehydratase